MWPLIGRAEILGIITRLAGQPGAPGVIFAGPPGVGKTRLAHEAVRTIAAAGTTVWRVTATRSAAMTPLGAFAGLLTATDEPLTTNLVERGVRALTSGRSGRVGVVVVDDAHLLDDVSAAVVHRAVEMRKITFVGTTQAGLVVPDWLTALWKDAGVVRLHVRPLLESDVEQLVVAALEGPVDGEALQRMWSQSAGNPVFIRELLLSARASGAITRHDGIWCLGAVPLRSDRLTELLQGRLSGLSAVERETLEFISVAGPISLHLLRGLADVTTLEALERASLVKIDEHRRRIEVTLQHPLLSELVRAHLPAYGAMRHSGVIAAAIAGVGLRRRDDLLNVVRLRVMAAQPVEAESLLIAARQAFGRDLALAERLARRAYESGGNSAAGVDLASALFGLGRTAEATEIAATLFVTDEAMAAEAALLRIMISTFGMDTNTFLDLRTLHGVLAAPGEGLASRLLTQLAAGMTDLLRGKVQTGVGDLAKSMKMDSSPYAAVGIVVWGVRILTALPDLVGARSLAETAYRAAVGIRSPQLQAWSALAAAHAALCAGQLASASRWARQAAALFSLMKSPAHKLAENLAGVVAVQRGEAPPVGARAATLPAVPAAAGETGSFDGDSVVAAAWRCVGRGDLDSARRTLVTGAERACAIGSVYWATALALELVRLHDPAAALAVLGQHPPAREWRLGAAVLAYAHAANSNDPTALCSAAETFESIGMLMHAAEGFTTASLAGRSQGSRRDPQRDAQRNSARANALVVRCSGAATPSLMAAGPASRLSRREHEIAVLASQGATSRSIAATLVLSERTVENHLQRAYQKLAVSSRTGLRQVLSGADLPGH